jgi:hypothetical protein
MLGSVANFQVSSWLQPGVIAKAADVAFLRSEPGRSKERPDTRLYTRH